MEIGELQNVLSNVDTAPQQEPELQIEQSDITSKIKYVFQMVVGCFAVLLPVRRGDEETGMAVDDIELGIIHTATSNEEDPDSNEVDQLTPPDNQLQRNPVSSDGKSVIQATVVLVFSGGSFGVMYQVPGGLNELGRAVMSDGIGFNIFLVAATLTFLASLVVAMILATMLHRSTRLNCFISITLWAAVVSFVFTFLAAAYLIVFPNHM